MQKRKTVISICVLNCGGRTERFNIMFSIAAFYDLLEPAVNNYAVVKVNHRHGCLNQFIEAKHLNLFAEICLIICKRELIPLDRTLISNTSKFF